MKTKRDSKYHTARNRCLKLWKQNNMFNDSNVDMAGLKFSLDNFATTHHIFYNNGKDYKLAVVGRRLHRYIDCYLKCHNKEEYDEWNKYLSTMSDYILNCVELDTDTKYKMIRWSNKLLFNAYKNKHKKAKHILSHLKPIILERFNEIVYPSLELNFNNPNFEYIDSENNESQNDNDMISSESIKTAFKKYINEQDSSSVMYDWMGLEVTLDNVVCVNKFLTKNSRSILNYLRANNTELYNDWKRYFRHIINQDLNTKEYKEILSDLRIRTYKYLKKTKLNLIDIDQDQVYDKICFDMYSPDGVQRTRIK